MRPRPDLSWATPNCIRGLPSCAAELRAAWPRAWRGGGKLRGKPSPPNRDARGCRARHSVVSAQVRHYPVLVWARQELFALKLRARDRSAKTFNSVHGRRGRRHIFKRDTGTWWDEPEHTLSSSRWQRWRGQTPRRDRLGRRQRLPVPAGDAAGFSANAAAQAAELNQNATRYKSANHEPTNAQPTRHDFPNEQEQRRRPQDRPRRSRHQVSAGGSPPTPAPSSGGRGDTIRSQRRSTGSISQGLPPRPADTSASVTTKSPYGKHFMARLLATARPGLEQGRDAPSSEHRKGTPL